MLSIQHGTKPLEVKLDEARLDAHIATHFKDQMRDLIAAAETNIVLDMHDVLFMDSSGLGALISIHKLMPRGHGLILSQPSENVYRVLKLTRMDTIFTIINFDSAGAKDSG